MSIYATMTTPELVSEWQRLTQTKIVKCINCRHENPPSLLGGLCHQCTYRLNTKWHVVQVAEPRARAEATAELDTRCENAGISIDPPLCSGSDYVFIYNKVKDLDNGSVYLGVSASEQQALQGYLLAKGVKP